MTHPPFPDVSQQSSGESSDTSRGLGALRDLLPALSALAPTGGPQLISLLTRWHQQQARALASSSGDRNPLGRSRTLQLAFWHAAHRVLAPLPPGALTSADVSHVVDLAFDAIVHGREPAPHVDAGWALRPLAGGASEGNGDTVGGGDTAINSQPPPLDPSPSVATLAARCLGLASRHDPDLVTGRLVDELEPRVNSEGKRGEVHLIIHGARFLHAPVSGGWRDARDGTLLFLCGGDQAAFDAALPGLDVMGSRRWLLGPTAGDAARAKLMLQVMMGNIVGSLAEMMALSKAAGLDEAAILEVLGESAMANPLCKAKGELMRKNDYKPNFQVYLQQKDLRLALQLADDLGVPAPISAASNGQYIRARQMGFADKDFAAVRAAYEAEVMSEPETEDA